MKGARFIPTLKGWGLLYPLTPRDKLQDNGGQTSHQRHKAHSGVHPGTPGSWHQYGGDFRRVSRPGEG